MSPLDESSIGRPQVAARQPTILLAEDEDQLRNMLSLVLGGFGYHIEPARDGLEAVQIAGAFSGAIDLLVSDVDMPGLNGPAVAKALQTARPQLKVILMSGLHTGEFVMQPDWEFLQKPFGMDALIAKVASLCGSQSGDTIDI